MNSLLFFDELCVPCFGVELEEQHEWADEIVKRRRYSYKQGPRPGEDESLSMFRQVPGMGQQ